MSGVLHPSLIRGSLKVDSPFPPMHYGQRATVTLHLTCHPDDASAVNEAIARAVYALHTVEEVNK